MSTALRVAIVGTGPSGLYAAAALLKRDATAMVDLFERLPTIGGLVRSGVSPDHAARRAVTAAYEQLLFASGRCRLIGNVEIGRQLGQDELAVHYHAVIHASGAAHDRRLGIPGEDLDGSHAATEFVGWYNGHPDHAQRRFRLDGERAVVIGNGNVALDVARMLLLSPEALRRTDIADHALAALSQSAIREVVILGRRGPAQAAFTAPELLELGELHDLDVIIDSPAAELVAPPGHPQALRLKLLGEYAQRGSLGRPKRLVLRFLASPVEICGDTQVRALNVVGNELQRAADGSVSARPTSRQDSIDTGLVFRSVGYRAQPLPGLPFDTAAGCIPNERGRIRDPATGMPLPGQYVAGWLKRGPSGVIGTNKPCSQQTVASLLADASQGLLPTPVQASTGIDALLATRGAVIVDRQGWARIDRHERQSGAASGRPRVKLTRVDEMLAIAG